MTTARWAVIRRRAISVPAVILTALLLTVLFVPLAVVLAVVDVVRGQPRLPLVRLLAFAVCWAWLETAGVAASGWLWMTGRAGDLRAHNLLQRWWVSKLMAALRMTCGVTVEVTGLDAMQPSPVILLMRHVSQADALVTTWLVSAAAELDLRVVLKHELLADPCLDIVGNRLANVFVDRGAEDSAPALAAMTRLTATMPPTSGVVIFPEGTLASPARRRRAIERIGQRDPGRAERLSALEHLLPPRTSGARALLEGAEQSGAGVVVGWHTGFDDMESVTGIIAAVGRRRTPITVGLRRVDPPDRLDSPTVEAWLDALWLELDRSVAGELARC